MSTSRVLVVDDEKGTRNALARGLRLAGFSVWSAATPKEALQLCEEHPFDLVVLDYMMPEMDGLELLVRIRKRIPLVRSIIISGKLDSAVDEGNITDRLKESVEADHFLHKPVRIARLVEVVNELLSDIETRNWKHIAADLTRPNKGKLGKAKQAADELKRIKKPGAQ